MNRWPKNVDLIMNDELDIKENKKEWIDRYCLFFYGFRFASYDMGEDVYLLRFFVLLGKDKRVVTVVIR